MSIGPFRSSEFGEVIGVVPTGILNVEYLAVVIEQVGVVRADRPLFPTSGGRRTVFCGVGGRGRRGRGRRRGRRQPTDESYGQDDNAEYDRPCLSLCERVRRCFAGLHGGCSFRDLPGG